MTLLTLIQNVAVKAGISQPDTVISNLNVEVQELLAFAQEEGRELCGRTNWQMLRTEKVFSALAQESQTAMIPSDFHHFVNQTFWNRTRRLPLKGPYSPQDWQRLKATSSHPSVNCFTYRGGNILITPSPTLNDTLAYEYISNTFCQTSGAVAQAAWAADTDTGILSEALMELGTLLRWKMAKGLPFDTDMAKYETQVTLTAGYDSPLSTTHMAGNGMMYGFEAPEGDWLH